jgi:hypothetical protein
MHDRPADGIVVRLGEGRSIELRAIPALLTVALVVLAFAFNGFISGVGCGDPLKRGGLAHRCQSGSL